MTQQAGEDAAATATAAAAVSGATAPAARAVQQLVKKRRKGLQVWAWLYSAAAAASEDAQQVDAPADSATTGSSSSSSSSSSSVEAPVAASRRRHRKTTKQPSNNSTSNASTLHANHPDPAAAVAPESMQERSYSRADESVLVLSWRQLQLPQQHPQWGQLMQQQQLTVEWQGPAGSTREEAQAGGGVDKAAGAVVAAADAVLQQQAARTQAATVAPNEAALQATAVFSAHAASSEDRSQHLPGSVRLHHSSTSQPWPASGAKQGSKQRLLFGADQCH
jgi:hypothetical protein